MHSGVAYEVDMPDGSTMINDGEGNLHRAGAFEKDQDGKLRLKIKV